MDEFSIHSYFWNHTFIVDPCWFSTMFGNIVSNIDYVRTIYRSIYCRCIDHWIGFRENVNRKPSIFPWKSWGFPVKSVKPILWIELSCWSLTSARRLLDLSWGLVKARSLGSREENPLAEPLEPLMGPLGWS